MEWRPMKVMTHDFHRSYQRDADAGWKASIGWLHLQYLTFTYKLHYCSHRKTKTSAVPKAHILSTVLKAQSVHPKPVFMHNLTPKPAAAGLLISS